MWKKISMITILLKIKYINFQNIHTNAKVDVRDRSWPGVRLGRKYLEPLPKQDGDPNKSINLTAENEIYF